MLGRALVEKRHYDTTVECFPWRDMKTCKEVFEQGEEGMRESSHGGSKGGEERSWKKGGYKEREREVDPSVFTSTITVS